VGASPEQLEREIEETRADLARTIGAIEERVSPRRIVRDNKQVIAGIAGGLLALVTLLVVRKVRR
jgi:hypothetical protein